MKHFVQQILEAATKKLKITERVELTPSKNHGDFSTNIALKAANQLGISPFVVAEKIVTELKKSKYIREATIAGPGFINLFLSSDIYQSVLADILSKERHFGALEEKRSLNVEYVSANPTGYLHIGHARNAVLGSTIVNLLRFNGNDVKSEYYINDQGNQINNLTLSVWWRLSELWGREVKAPDDAYHGQEIIECAKDLRTKLPKNALSLSYSDLEPVIRAKSLDFMLKSIKHDLKAIGVEISTYTSEAELYTSGKVQKALDSLIATGHTYKDGGATWLRTTTKGDDRDRVLIKADGQLTYFAPDIANHINKLKSSKNLINIWGADHIGYIKRLTFALEYLGYKPDQLNILTIQLVKLMRHGEEVKMSKRSGNSFTLIDLVEEIGSDAARWFLLDRANTSEIVFDLDKAKSLTTDNPVFNVKYTHARAAQLLHKAAVTEINPGLYNNKEMEIIRYLLDWPQILADVSTNLKVHLIPQYLLGLSALFNSWYSNNRIVGTERESEMLALVLAVRNTLAIGLNILGISAPDKV